jgi:hypothetical protein
MGNEKLEKLKKENGWTGLTSEKKEILKSFCGSITIGENKREVNPIIDYAQFKLNIETLLNRQLSNEEMIEVAGEGLIQLLKEITEKELQHETH